jgi:hypothetical protein
LETLKIACNVSVSDSPRQFAIALTATPSPKAFALILSFRRKFIKIKPFKIAFNQIQTETV